MSAPGDYRTNGRFRVLWNGRTGAVFDDVSPLPVDLKHTSRPENGGPPPAIGPEGQKTPYFINLDRGVILDPGFAQWVSMVRCYGPATGKGSLLPEYKQPLTIEAGGEDGSCCVYHLSRCWVDEYRAIPGPGDREITVEHMRLGFDTWTRDSAGASRGERPRVPMSRQSPAPIPGPPRDRPRAGAGNGR
jgi:hypothetical protein